MPRWMRWLMVMAGLRVLAGLGVALTQPLRHAATAPGFPLWIFVLQVAVFGSVGIWLILGGHADRRSQVLGGFYLLVANAFSGVLLRIGLRSIEGPARWALDALSALALESFLPAFLWLFLNSFPYVQLYNAGRWIPRVLARVSALAGSCLLVLNLVLGLVPTLSPGTRLALAHFSRNASVSEYWTVLFALLVPGIPFMIWKARRADTSERRRVRLFVTGFAIGTGPLFLQVFLENVVPAIGAAMNNPAARRVAGAVLFPAMLTVPFTTAYAVRVHHALDVRLIVRRALQYLLARYSIAIATALPFVAFVWYVSSQRDQRVEDLVRGRAAIAAAAFTGAGLLMFWLRKRVLRTLDRRFFREQHDAGRILSELADGYQASRTAGELAERLGDVLVRALHVESFAVLLFPPSQRMSWVAAGKARPLPRSASLVAWLFSDGTTVDVDWTRPSPGLRAMSPEDRDWLVDGAFRLLVPLVPSGAAPIGFIALGEKQSELPFSLEDRLLLKSMTASAALELEHRFLGGSAEGHARVESNARADDEQAFECRACGWLEDAGVYSCSHCGGPLDLSPLPRIIGDKFEVQCRVGAGGMGVVYRAVDLSLDRLVALKCLPRREPAHASWLRREAKAMAAVSHPNLALIHGSESWHGQPILILEFMDGGTLSDRLRFETLTIDQVLELGLVLSGALRYLHERGIIHCDIKPSNLGFTHDRVPKLLDFGIARMLMDHRRPSWVSPRPGKMVMASAQDPTASTQAGVRSGLSTVNGIVGTPLYMSPEALGGLAPEPMFDLWSLSLVLYELIAGRHPFAGSSRWGAWPPVPALNSMSGLCPASVSDFFAAALAEDRSRRPARAADLHAGLERLRVQMRSQGAMDSPPIAS